MVAPGRNRIGVENRGRRKGDKTRKGKGRGRKMKGEGLLKWETLGEGGRVRLMENGGDGRDSYA